MSSPNKPKSNFPISNGGLPGWEMFALNAIFKTRCGLMSDARLLALFERQTKAFLRLVEDDDSYDAFDQLSIPRVIGIEESSRRWSLMMILDHLYLVNLDIHKVVQALVDEIVPRGEIEIAMYKPSPDVGFDVIDRYRDLNRQYHATVSQILQRRGNLKTSSKYRHPWFGLLDAHGWHCLIQAHQAIHWRQAKKVIAMLGVT